MCDQIPESEAAQKKAEADRLRAAEKFMVVGTGEAVCAGCGYEYLPKNGDPEYPITPGTPFTVRPQPAAQGNELVFCFKMSPCCPSPEVCCGSVAWPCHMLVLSRIMM